MINVNFVFLSVLACKTHPADVSRPELDCAEQAEDDDDDVDEVGQDGSPLVAQEVDYLPLQHADLVEDRRRRTKLFLSQKIYMEKRLKLTQALL